MSVPSRYKGIFTIDALMSIIPTLLIFVFLMNAMSLVAESDRRSSEQHDVFDRLVSVADYSVKSGLARHEGDVRYPNWLDGKIEAAYVEDLREKVGFSTLEISFTEPEMDTCIFRLVVVGENKEMRKLYFCGDDNADA